jgi:4-amino-4-deoxy-L-arabinose transferase-like glycosyltransferase
VSASRDRACSALVFVLALVPRLWVALAWAKEPVWDGHYYDFGARRIAAGLGYSDDVVIGGLSRWHPWCHYPVGYSGFLGLVYKVFGHGQAVAPLANALVGATLAVLGYLLARRLLDERRALLAALLIAFSPELVAYTALLMTEPLASVGPFVAALAVLAFATTRPLVGAGLGGAALGLATLVRPQTLLAAPALALLYPYADSVVGDLKKRLAVAIVATTAALAVVAPWSLRNCRVMDGCALVSTNGGWNLAIGALPGATGRFRTLRAADGCPVVTGQVQQDSCWRDEALAVIRRDPRAWLALVPKKLGNTFDHASFPLGYLGEADPVRFPEPRKAQGREILTTAHRALLALACLAFVKVPARGERRPAIWAREGAKLLAIVLLTARAAWSDEHTFWPLAVLLPLLALVPSADERGSVARRVLGFAAFQVAALVVTHAVFFGEDRYHVVLTPVLAVLAAAGLRRSGPVEGGESAPGADEPAIARVPVAADESPLASGSPLE